METYLFEHISYEMAMYIKTYELINSGSKEIFVHNAFWESHIIHLRNLIDFFNNYGNYEDDITISKVLIDATNYNFEIPEELRKTINKSVQHLSTFRGKELDKKSLSENIRILYPIIINRIKKFWEDVKNVDNLTAEYKDDYMDYIESENHFVFVE